MLRPLTQAERQAVEDSMNVRIRHPDGRVETMARTRQVALELAVTHIEAIENYPVGSPKPYPDPDDPDARRAYLEQLPDESVREIGNEIYGHSTLTAEEAAIIKNSLPPGPMSSSGGE